MTIRPHAPANVLAALNESCALNEFYKQRTQLLSQELFDLKATNEALESKCIELEGQLPALRPVTDGIPPVSCTEPVLNEEIAESVANGN